MINIKDINISSHFGVDFLYVELFINDTIEDLSKYRFDLYRSNDSSSEFVMIGPNITNFEFIDRDVNLKSLSIKYYYKVVVTNTITDESTESDVYMYGVLSVPDDVAYYISEISKTYLDSVVDNHKMVLLKRKKTGQLCPRCYDEIRKKPQNPSCNICFGTNYVDGYFPPKVISVCYIDQHSIFQDFSIYGVGDKKIPLGLWTSNFPIIQNDDVLIDMYGSRYIVTNWQPSVKNSYILRQTVKAMMLPKNNQIYNLEIDPEIINRVKE